MGFPDHHVYTEHDMQRLYDKARTVQLITTEKDAVKIPSHWQNKIQTLPITLTIENQKDLDKWLETHLSSNA